MEGPNGYVIPGEPAMPDLLDSASNLHAVLLRREFSARGLLGATLAALERFNPVLDAIVQKDAATTWRAASDSDARKAALMLGEAGPGVFVRGSLGGVRGPHPCADRRPPGR